MDTGKTLVPSNKTNVSRAARSRGNILSSTVCFFSTATKDDVITQLNDLILTFAMNQFEEYFLAFVL